MPAILPTKTSDSITSSQNWIILQKSCKREGQRNSSGANTRVRIQKVNLLSQFNFHLSQQLIARGPSMVLEHKAGEKL
jgi:hypothetical protein